MYETQKEKKNIKTTLPDTQNQIDKRNIPINRVGVKNLKYPIIVKDRQKETQNTIATISMTVDLPKHFKGTHMSRFVEILQSKEDVIHIDSIFDLLDEMKSKLNASAAHIEMEFPYFRVKKAPATKKPSLMDYTVKFHAVKHNSDTDFIMTVKVPVTTLCPCSKNISEYHTDKNSILIITHLNQLLKFIRPDRVHVLINGRIVGDGGPELADEIEENGFDSYRAAAEE